MGRFSVNVILLINKLFPMTDVHEDLATSKKTTTDYQDWEYEEIEKIHVDFGEYFDLGGQRVLDVGCGLGGKMSFYTEFDPKSVVGIDLRFLSLLSANQLFDNCDQCTADGAQFSLADAKVLPFESSSFGRIISVNVLEHVEEPYEVLKECHRVLEPDGLLLLHFPPFFSPWGAHLDSWINWPWPHLFFRECDLVTAAAEVEEDLRLNDRFIPSGQVNWRQLEALYELNRLTVREFKAFIDRLTFQVVYWRLLPFGRHFLPTKGLLGRLLLRFLVLGTKMPLINEAITTKIVCVLKKRT